MQRRNYRPYRKRRKLYNLKLNLAIKSEHSKIEQDIKKEARQDVVIVHFDFVAFHFHIKKGAPKVVNDLVFVIEAVNPTGLDFHFFTRPNLVNVIFMDGLQDSFTNAPNGGTPLITTLNKVYND